MLADSSWIGTGTDSNWSTLANWSANGIPSNVPASTAIFNNAGNGKTTITIGNVAVNILTFDQAGAAAYTLGSGVNSGTLTLDIASTGGKINVNNTVVNSQTINSVLVLGTSAAAGTYVFTNNSTSGTMTLAGSIQGGTGGTAGVEMINFGGNSGAGKFVISGSVSAGGATAMNVQMNSNSNVFFANNVMNTGTLIMNTGTFSGSGTLGANIGVNADAAGTIGGSNNLLLSGSLELGSSANGGVGQHWTTITVNNTGTTTFGGGINMASQKLFLQGSGNVVISGPVVSLTGAPAQQLTYQGTGTMTLSGSSNAATGLAANLGTMVLDASTNSSATWGGGNGSASNVGVSGTSAIAGNATLLVKGNFSVGLSTSTLTVVGGNGTTTGQGTLSLVDGTINTLSLKTTSAVNSNILVLGANSIMNMEVGGTADEIVLGSGTERVTVNSTVLVNIKGLGNLNGTTQTLLLTSNASAFTIGSGNNFILNTTSGNFNGYVVGLSGATTGQLQLTETLTYTTPATAFWSGSVSGTWNSIVNGNANNTNWLSAASSGTDVHATPGSTTNVVFNASGATNTNTVLGANTTINSLEFTSASSGAASATIGSGTLTINASGTNFQGAAGVGITVDASSGTNTINSALALGGNQKWIVNNSQSAPLTVNGVVSGAQNLTLGGTGATILAGANSYTGSTIVTNGMLQVNGSLNASSAVSVSGSGASSVATLGGTGTINGTVSVGGGSGIQRITGGTPTTNGTLTLAGGLTLNSGGIAYFSNPLTTTAGNFIFLSSGSFLANSGAVIEVPSLSVGTYQLIGSVSGVYTGTSNITIENLLGSTAPANYSLQISSGTLQLVVAAVTTAQPTLTLGNARVIIGQSGTLSGVVGNNAGGGTLSGTLSDNSGAQTAGSGTLNVTSFPTNPVVVAAGTSANYTAVISNVGSSTGANTVNTIVTDGSASPTTATATGTVNVLQNRVVTASTGTFGSVHINASGSAATSLTSPGADNANTRVTVGNGGTDSGTNGIQVAGGNTGTVFNGGASDNRNLTGTFGTLGAQSGTVTLATTGEGLTGESPISVGVGYTAQVFSGQASWASSTGGSWATNSGWGDTNAGDLNGGGAPGLSGAASIGDTATFNDVSGQSGTSTISLNGVSPTLASLTFNSTNGYSIVAGSGGGITLQSATTNIAVSTGTDSISVAMAGSGAGIVKSGTGTLILGGANSYTGSTDIANGVVQTTGASVLPSTTNLVFGDLSNHSGQLILGGNQTLTGGIGTIGTGTSNSIVGGTSSTSTLTLNMGASPSTVSTFAGNLGGGGTNQNNLALTMTGSGVQVITGSITYTGATNLSGGVLQTSNMLPNTSSISLSSPSVNTSGGVWQPTLSGSTNYVFNLGTNAAGNVSNWTGGGFAAYGGVLNLTANSGAVLGWGGGAGTISFAGVGGQGITFGSQTSNNQVILTNSINLETSDAFQQLVIVNGTTAGSSALLSGQITQTTGVATASGLKKAGLGTLILSNTSNNFSGFIFVEQGTLVAGGNSASGLGTVFGTGTGPSNGPTSPSAINLGDNTTTNASNPSLMLGGAFIVDRNILVTNDNASSNNVNAIGGLADASGTFSGTITVQTASANNNSFAVTQVATTGNHALNITNQINGAAGNSVNFSNVGAVVVSGSIIGNGMAVTQSGAGTTTLSSTGNSYSGSTVINNGNLRVTNSAGSATGSGTVNITPNANASATLSGNGIITGLVTATTGTGSNVAHIAPAVNTSGNLGVAGTLTLSGGLTLNAGTNLDFDLSNSATTVGGGVNDLIALNGGVLTLPTGAGTITINYGVLGGGAPVTGTAYTLISGVSTFNNFNASNFVSTGTSGLTPFYSVSGSNLLVTFLAGGGVNSTTYTLTAVPASTRVMLGGTVGINSVVTNTGTTGSPASDNLAYTNLNSSATNGAVGGSGASGTIAPTASGTNTTTYTASGSTGLVTITPAATGTNATLGTAATLQSTTTGTVAVLANRSVTASTVNLGDVLVGGTASGTTTLSTASGDDNHATRITVLSSGSTNGTATVGSGTGAVLFNGNGVSTTRGVTASFGTSGTASGSVSLSVIGEGLAGESDTAPTVGYTANVFQAFSGTDTVASGTTLNLTNFASTDGGQRAGISITGFSSTNSNFIVTPSGGAAVGTANGSDVTATVGTVTVANNLLSGTYTYNGTVTGTAQYTDTALQGTAVGNQTWSGVSVTGTVSASVGYNTQRQAFVANGGALAGYGLTSNTGFQSTAVFLNGTTSADSTVTMKFTANGGHPANPFQSSDTLTLGGLHQTGSFGVDGSVLTDAYVLQLSSTAKGYIAWWDANTFQINGNGNWVNAIAGNSTANLPTDYGDNNAFLGTYAAYLTAHSFTTSTPLSSELGAYGYYFDGTSWQAWAVLDHNSDFEVIPEPSTYAMIFSGFGMLIGFRRLRRRK